MPAPPLFFIFKSFRIGFVVELQRLTGNDKDKMNIKEECENIFIE